jgi:hypothetical protein
MGYERDPRRAVDAFARYSTDQRARLHRLEILLGEAMPLVVNMEACNERFREARRPDLVMTHPAKMDEYLTLEELREKGNNFLPAFKFISSSTIVKDARGYLTVQETLMTEDGIRRIADAPPADDDVNWDKHAVKPAFQRMLVLFPDFTAPLVTSLSQPNAQSRVADFESELFVAYQLMSHLVDKKDKNVVRDDGQVDGWYLCR